MKNKQRDNDYGRIRRNVGVKISDDINCCVSMNEGMQYEFRCNKVEEDVFLYEFQLTWQEKNVVNNHAFEIRWSVPLHDILYRWTPSCCLDRSIALDRSVYEDTMISSKAPAVVFFNGKSENRYSWAVNECVRQVSFNTGIIEENHTVESVIRLSLGQFAAQKSERLILRMDFRNISIKKAVNAISEWWSGDCGMWSAYAPKDSKKPVYSFWYSYHQRLSAREIEEECRRAKKMGFDICIIDDGWQTDDRNRGYAFCGDWKPSSAKIPNMKTHVDAVHKIGMKYVLWYSVPFMGYKSEHYDEFCDMILRDDAANQAGILDPRYKKVRDFLINIYKTAMLSWKLDGFKLDFIDVWCNSENNKPYEHNMDIAVLQDAVDVFMSSVYSELKKINPEVLIEFRQTYIGPNMKKYGNMFRVGDCPNDLLKNRAGVLDLRMLMGNLAVHSDMLMWNKDEKPELAALQIISVLFGVIQYSEKLEYMSDRMKQMSYFWLKFVNEKRDLLLNSELEVYEPQQLYTWAKASNASECIAAVYSVDKCVKPDERETIYIANGSENDRILSELNGSYYTEVMDCYGNTVFSGRKIMNNINVIEVPMGGLAILKRI